MFQPSRIRDSITLRFAYEAALQSGSTQNPQSGSTRNRDVRKLAFCGRIVREARQPPSSVVRSSRELLISLVLWSSRRFAALQHRRTTIRPQNRAGTSAEGKAGGERGQALKAKSGPCGASTGKTQANPRPRPTQDPAESSNPVSIG